MINLKFIKAEKVTYRLIYVTYELDGFEFKVRWFKRYPEADYVLTDQVSSENKRLGAKITEAIRAGDDSTSNKYLDLYELMLKLFGKEECEKVLEGSEEEDAKKKPMSATEVQAKELLEFAAIGESFNFLGKRLISLGTGKDVDERDQSVYIHLVCSYLNGAGEIKKITFDHSCLLALRAENTVKEVEPVDEVVFLHDALVAHFGFPKLVVNKNNQIIELHGCNLNNYPHPLPDSVRRLFHCDLSGYPHPLPDSVEWLYHCDLSNYPHPLPDSVIELLRCNLENYKHPIPSHVKIEA